MPAVDDAGQRAQRWLAAELARAGLSKRAVLAAVGMDQRTLDKILSGQPVKRGDRLAALARHLGYEGDAFERVRRGEAPVPLAVADTGTEYRFRALERRVDRLEALLEDAVRRPASQEVE